MLSLIGWLGNISPVPSWRIVWPALHCAMAKGPPSLPAGVCAVDRHPLAGPALLRCLLWLSHCMATTAKCLVELVVLGALHSTLQPGKVLCWVILVAAPSSAAVCLL